MPVVALLWTHLWSDLSLWRWGDRDCTLSSRYEYSMDCYVYIIFFFNGVYSFPNGMWCFLYILAVFKILSWYFQGTFCCNPNMSLLTHIGQFRAQCAICEIGCNPQILLYIEIICHCSGTYKAFLQCFAVCPYPCYPEKLHECSLPSHHLSLFPGRLWWFCTVLMLQNPFSDIFFKQCLSPSTYCFLLFN